MVSQRAPIVQSDLSLILDELHRTLGPMLPDLVSEQGERVPLGEAIAYSVDGLGDQALGDTLPSTPGLPRRLAGLFRAKRDRRWLAYELPHVAKAPTRWIHILRANPGSWRRFFEPVVAEVSRLRPDLGVVVIEEVRKGHNPALGGLGEAVPLSGPRYWSPDRPLRRINPGNLPGAIGERNELARVLSFQTAMQSRILCRLLDAVTIAFKRWPPAAILLVNDLESNRRSVALLAQRRGLPVINLQHGMINDTPPYRLGIADRHLLWGRSFSGILQRRGIAAERLAVVGSPHYDQVAREFVRKPPAGPVRLREAAQPPSFEIPLDTCLHLIDLHAQLAERHPDIEVVIRLHPRETAAVQRYADAACARRANLNRCGEPDIVAALSRCSVTSLVFSTVALDAAVGLRPAVILDLAGCAHRFPFDRRPPFFAARGPQDLYEVVVAADAWGRSADAEPGFVRFAEEHLSGLDGQAAWRAGELVAGITES